MEVEHIPQRVEMYKRHAVFSGQYLFSGSQKL